MLPELEGKAGLKGLTDADLFDHCYLVGGLEHDFYFPIYWE